MHKEHAFQASSPKNFQRPGASPALFLCPPIRYALGVVSPIIRSFGGEAAGKTGTGANDMRGIEPWLSPASLLNEPTDAC
ncbi:hypothetical protein [Sphingomonas sp.]|uniref:hypothetical protein n=1 Tax=Sphingomonas sp. TaxID=28214 RepID=UPI0035BC0AB3